MNVELLSATADQVWTVVQGKCRGESQLNCYSGLTRCGQWKVNVEVSLTLTAVLG